VAPQLVHRFSRMTRQQSSPRGKKKMQQRIPQSVKPSLKTPTCKAKLKNHITIRIQFQVNLRKLKPIQISNP